MTQRSYMENMGYQLMFAELEHMSSKGEPLEAWMKQARIGSKKDGDENVMVDTGQLPPLHVGKRIIQRLIREAHVEPVPGSPKLFRPTVDQGRNTTAVRPPRR